MEPDWEDLEGRLMALPVRKLRQLGRTWFNGSLGGASTKRDIAHAMASQAEHWWKRCADLGGHKRVRNVMLALEQLEEE